MKGKAGPDTITNRQIAKARNLLAVESKLLDALESVKPARRLRVLQAAGVMLGLPEAVGLFRVRR